MDVALAGFLTGLSLIVAIGAQNAYVLRLGLARNHVGVAVVICAGADALLIAIGVGGLGAIVQTHGDVLTAIALLGGAYLLWFAFRSFRSALHPDVLLPSQQEPQAVAAVALAVLGLTFLNPHVYLDTILLVGTIGASFGADRWWFALGAAITTSQCRSIVVPTPTALPLTAAINGLGNSRSEPRKRATSLSCPVGGFAKKSAMSLPAVK